MTSEPIIPHAATIIPVTIYVSPEYIIRAEEGVIGLEETASNIAGLLPPVTATPGLAILTLLATDQARGTTGYERCCWPGLDCCDNALGLLISPSNIFVYLSIVMLLITAVVMLHWCGVLRASSALTS